MDPNIRNFSQIEKFIKENPRQADAQAFEWQQFLKTNAPISPELYSIETAEEFYKWAQEHPEKNIDPSVWVGKEISDSYYYLRDQHENDQMQTAGTIDTSAIPSELGALPVLAASFFERPKIMQHDNNYEKIEDRLRKEWLKKNNLKDFSSQEGLNYLYGKTEHPDPLKTGVGEESQTEINSEEAWTKSVNAGLPKTTTLAQDAESSFRNNPKFKKRAERYDREKKKIYKNQDDDPIWQRNKYDEQLETSARLRLLEKTRDKKIKISKEDIEKSQDEITTIVNKKYQEEFSLKHPEKAKAYRQREDLLKQRQQERDDKRDQSIPNRVLKQILKEESPPMQEIPLNKPASLGQRIGNGLSRAQNAMSKAGRASSRAGAQAGKTAAQAGRLAAQAATRGIMAFLATPPGWITVGVVVALLIVVFIIVYTKGRDKYPPQENIQEANEAINDTTSTAPTPTPTPVL